MPKDYTVDPYVIVISQDFTSLVCGYLLGDARKDWKVKLPDPDDMLLYDMRVINHTDIEKDPLLCARLAAQGEAFIKTLDTGPLMSESLPFGALRRDSISIVFYCTPVAEAYLTTAPDNWEKEHEEKEED